MEEQASYAVKRVEFFGRSVKICMQNNNGPCPLLAIANVLSLRNELKLPSGIRSITQSNLITAIVDLLLERSKHIEETSAADYQQTISDIFPILRKLTTGIDVNVKFHNCHAFEATPEVAVFDLLGISLVHGWLIDPQDAPTAAVFSNKSYNELVELLLLGLDDAEKEQLASGPLRSLSFTPTHSFKREREQTQQQDTPQPFIQFQNPSAPTTHHTSPSTASPATGAVAPAAHGAMQPLHPSQAGSSASVSTPSLRRIATRSTSDTTSPRAAAAAADLQAPGPAAIGNGPPLSEADAVIEELVEEMMQHLCSDNMPDRIELGDSPTLATKLNRKFAYEGAAPSRLSNAGSAANHSTAAFPTAAVTSSHGAAATATAAAPVTPVHQQCQPRVPSSSGVKPGAKAAADARVVRQFMESHCSQLTPFGLTSLADSLKEHQLAVFFRNNHFNTLFKYEGGVYLLVTDQGYECEPDIVWERLDSVNGDTTFCTGGFTAFLPHRDPEGPASYSEVAAGGVHPALTDFDAAIAASLAAADESHHESGHNTTHDVGQHEPGPVMDHEDADFALALQLQLQEEEEARVARERQQQQQQGQGSAPQQQPRVQQLQQQQQASGQFSAESLAAGVRQVGRRIVSSAEKAASNLAQQRQQYVQQQQATHAAQQQQRAAQQAMAQQQQQQHVPPPQQQYMMQQDHRRQQRRAQHATGASRKQQEEKCSIM